MFILDGFWDAVGGAISDGFRSLMLSLCDIIYKLIVFFFNIFMKLGSAEILSEPILDEFYNRVGLILGLFMIFRVTFSLIQYVMDPDLMNDKQKGLFNIVKRIFIVVVLLGVTRPLFDFAYDAQKLIINSNVIPKIITGQNIDSADAGSTLAWYTFNSFYKFNKNYVETTEVENVAKSCFELNSNLMENDFKNNNTLRYAYNCVNVRYSYRAFNLNTTEEYSDYIIDFPGNGIIAVIVGIIILFVIVMYSVQVGIRVLQLSYLQLIAPIPIIGYLAPKGEDMLNKWFKQCTTTYLDFFIRVAVLYLIVFIIQLLIGIDNDTFLNSLGNVSDIELGWITIIMIVALLLFALKVPKLLQEVFPSLGGGAAGFSFGLNPKKEIFDPLKQIYNTTPLGWAPKALGWAGKKTISAIDRKVHNVPKPRGKFGQYIDKLMPERAKDIAASRQAQIDANSRKRRDLHGEQIFDSSTYIDEKTGKRKFDPSKAFTGLGSVEYIDSYNKVKAAKNDMKTAETLVSEIDKELTAAYNMEPGEKRDAAIELAKSRRDAAVKNYGAYESRYNLAKEQHDGMRKMTKYAKFAKVEDDYKYYIDRHPEFVEIPDSKKTPDSKPNTNQQQSSGQNSDNSNSDDYEQVIMDQWEEYVDKDDKVSETHMNVAEAIGKEPFTESVAEAIEEYHKAEQERDVAAEQLKETAASDSSTGAQSGGTSNESERISNISDFSKMTKQQLLKKKSEYEKHVEKMKKEYDKLEEKKMLGNEKVNDKIFIAIKNDIAATERLLEYINSLLNNL